MIIEYIELNWLCKYIKKIRSSQAAILVLNWVKQFFSVSIVKGLNFLGHQFFANFRNWFEFVKFKSRKFWKGKKRRLWNKFFVAGPCTSNHLHMRRITDTLFKSILSKTNTCEIYYHKKPFGVNNGTQNLYKRSISLENNN